MLLLIELYRCGGSTLLIHETCIWDVLINLSTKQHSDSGMGCLAFRQFSTREVVEYFYGLLASSDLVSELIDDKTYEERVVLLSRKQFLN